MTCREVAFHSKNVFYLYLGPILTQTGAIIWTDCIPFSVPYLPEIGFDKQREILGVDGFDIVLVHSYQVMIVPACFLKYNKTHIQAIQYLRVSGIYVNKHMLLHFEF